MSKPFSSHEFFIEEGGSFIVEVEPHRYLSGENDDDDGDRPEKELENARLLISSGHDEAWDIEVSIPKEALKQLVRIAEKYLKDGEGDAFMFGCE